MPSRPIRLTFPLLAISVFSVSQGHPSPRGGSRSGTNPRSLCPCTPSSSSTCLCESPLSLVTWNTRTWTRQWADLPLSLGHFSFRWVVHTPLCSPCLLAESAFSSSPPVTWLLRSSLSSSASTRWCRPGNTFGTSERPRLTDGRGDLFLCARVCVFVVLWFGCKFLPQKRLEPQDPKWHQRWDLRRAVHQLVQTREGSSPLPRAATVAFGICISLWQNVWFHLFSSWVWTLLTCCASMSKQK